MSFSQIDFESHIQFSDEELEETPFDRQALISWWDQKKLNDAFVLVAGAGALGNETIKNLALMGVGHIFIVDFDLIEISNLSRSVLFRMENIQREPTPKASIAAQQAQRMNPNSEAEVYAATADLVWGVGLGVFRRANVVLGCLDNVEARRSINRYCRWFGKDWIDAGILELAGSVTFYPANPDSACYECNITDEQWADLSHRYSCAEAIHDQLNQRHEPTIQTTSAIMSAIQTQEAIKILHGFPIPEGRRLVFRGHYHNFVPEDTTQSSSVTSVSILSRNPQCSLHQEFTLPIVELPVRSIDYTLRILLDEAERRGLADPIFLPGEIREEYLFIVSLTCQECHKTELINRPIFQNKIVDTICPFCSITCHSCGAVFHRDELTPTLNCPKCNSKQEISFREANPEKNQKLSFFARNNAADLLDWPLSQLGIPELDIVCVQGENHEKIYFELSGDASHIFVAANK